MIGYYQGVKEAIKEIRDDRSTIMVNGWRSGIGVDRKTGLLLRNVAECEESLTLHGYIHGHNQYVYRYYNKHSLPRYSFYKWINYIYNPKIYMTMDNNTTIDKRYYTVDDYSIRYNSYHIIIKREELKDVASKSKITRFYICHTKRMYQSTYGIMHALVKRIAWGPKGSHLLFIKWVDLQSNKYIYGSIDANSGQWLTIIGDDFSIDGQHGAYYTYYLRP